ncbi:MAG: hypothetical protein J6B72_05190 [Clostridia bacterium]|nr:hypothetical protein [Clostridia bacterium]
MKNYQTPELNIIKVAKIGDVITYSRQTEGYGDIRDWETPNPTDIA